MSCLTLSILLFRSAGERQARWIPIVVWLSILLFRSRVESCVTTLAHIFDRQLSILLFRSWSPRTAVAGSLPHTPLSILLFRSLANWAALHICPLSLLSILLFRSLLFRSPHSSQSLTPMSLLSILLFRSVVNGPECIEQASTPFNSIVQIHTGQILASRPQSITGYFQFYCLDPGVCGQVWRGGLRGPFNSIVQIPYCHEIYHVCSYHAFNSIVQILRIQRQGEGCTAEIVDFQFYCLDPDIYGLPLWRAGLATPFQFYCLDPCYTAQLAWKRAPPLPFQFYCLDPPHLRSREGAGARPGHFQFYCLDPMADSLASIDSKLTPAPDLSILLFRSQQHQPHGLATPVRFIFQFYCLDPVGGRMTDLFSLARLSILLFRSPGRPGTGPARSRCRPSFQFYCLDPCGLVDRLNISKITTLSILLFRSNIPPASNRGNGRLPFQFYCLDPRGPHTGRQAGRGQAFNSIVQIHNGYRLLAGQGRGEVILSILLFRSTSHCLSTGLLRPRSVTSPLSILLFRSL